MTSSESSSPCLAARVGDRQGAGANRQSGIRLAEGERANRFVCIQGDRISSRHSDVSDVTRKRDGITRPVALGSPGSVATVFPVASWHTETLTSIVEDAPTQDC